ncbi:uncharacterized protein BDR25DRAFT_215346 [Lindgomyces ingoldianus]|uniref:Uncharacterized protein n=1 Tax=Lindgomyces ingoldianus TaxID=673940 RepID=A0ACB6R756_9PLEO|nr:uncharacterized protein BDR25DRAFT_215346 [Lindgomyces ingoldianus]KAF2475001.1 hypothetical protein BDR25DRAFT_215346 [Lindgomyces ingoldianus]
MDRGSNNVSNIDVDLAQRAMHSQFGDPNAWSMEQLHGLGWLPGGGLTSFPLMRDDEVPLQNAPYSTWAVAPYNRINASLMDRITGAFFKEGLAIVAFPARLQSLKAKLWNGMVPMTGGRWKEKKLDDPKNFQQFQDLMVEILKIFAFMNDENVQQQLRQGYNWLWKEYETYEVAINARREQMGIAERMNITGMWEEYMRAIFKTISGRTHQWLVDRVEELQVKSKIEYEKEYDAARIDTPSITAAGKIFFERVQDLNLAITQADFVCFLPMEGFKGHDTSRTGIEDLSLEVRQNIYYQLADTKSWDNHIPFSDHENRNAGLQNREALMAYFDEARNNRAVIRREFRGEPEKLGDEHWITILKSRIDWYLKHGGDPEKQTWGFVCYRLTYKQTDEEWAQFKEKLEADLMRAGDWVEGADKVKATGGLQWIDGRDVGIAEEDIEGAKRHFATFATPSHPDFMRRMWKQDFLVVDSQSCISYSHPFPESRPPFGDSGGHIRLVDPAVYDPELIRQTAPGFTGNFKVLTTLVFDEIYPLLSTLAQRPKDLWPLARLHPLQIYVGPTVKAQEEEWEFHRSMKADMLPAFFEYVRNKQRQGGNGSGNGGTSSSS